MSSIDDERLRRFYLERLEPAARHLRARKREFFSLGPDAISATYYVPPPVGPDFTSLDEAECGDVLRDLWMSQGLPELADLVNEMMVLARELEVVEEDSAEISPFVYVMY